MIGAIAVTGMERKAMTIGDTASAKFLLAVNATARPIASAKLKQRPSAALERVYPACSAMMFHFRCVKALRTITGDGIR